MTTVAYCFSSDRDLRCGIPLLRHMSSASLLSIAHLIVIDVDLSCVNGLQSQSAE